MMNMNSFIERERKSIEKFKKYQIPNIFKKVGFGLFVISIITFSIVGFSSNDFVLQSILRYGMLIGLLFISISKEKIEDELVRDLRMQSFSFAFIVAVLYTLAMPFVEYFVDFVAQNQNTGIEDLGDFTILWILLCSQIGYFTVLKKGHR